MLFIRSALFNIAFYINTIGRLIIMLPWLYFGSKETVLAQAKAWGQSSIRLQEIIAGTKVEIEGLENLPKDRGFIVAAQHQSFWDTFAFFQYIDSPVFIFKQELLRIPLFGRCLTKLKMISVDRGAKGKAMASVMVGAKREIGQNGRQLFIFPEGTRSPVGAPLDYKFGAARIYSGIDVPLVPIALVSGLYWPRHSFLRQPGHFKARILPPIEPGLSIRDALEKLTNVTQEASDELLLDAVENNPNLPLPPLVVQRLEDIKSSATV
ncbi:lysophospholipid acyltransferase family protein [Lentilitoribacter sp. EG35]|uniref:lysophospholipid acyltransferase family protein n=1 Tax=Lentilitoribacter sp. EG35 TaxID=3234192 RepID=UPI0034611F1A